MTKYKVCVSIFCILYAVVINDHRQYKDALTADYRMLSVLPGYLLPT